MSRRKREVTRSVLTNQLPPNPLVTEFSWKLVLQLARKCKFDLKHQGKMQLQSIVVALVVLVVFLHDTRAALKPGECEGKIFRYTTVNYAYSHST